MIPEFYRDNRDKFARSMKEGDIALFMSGSAPRKSADECYPFFTNRNFLYLTGVEQKDAALVLVREGDSARATLFLPKEDALAERWTGKRVRFSDASARSMITDIRPREELDARLDALLLKMSDGALYLDLDRYARADAPTEAYTFASYVRERFPERHIENASPILRRLRTIKTGAEISAMRHAEGITREGILAMMHAAKPGVTTLELKAEFDRALAKCGVLSPAFPSIISAGSENFYIHNDRYDAVLKDGDMVLNDVGAAWDGMCTDVSRGWPCNGRFSEKQRLLYECAYATSNYMFSILRAGVPQASIDESIRRFNFERLKDAGVCASYDEIGKYMWHGGAHHVGFDTHDVADRSAPLAPGMVFCVDVGIYHEEWGIGFRLEDNCLITENGCENLSVATPRSVEEIEDELRMNR